eukprot:Blabericola_migrator_1__1046@NODE_1266_length_4939_cov_239_532635_g855_i0_p1_GENE_NODE_1266_length_4939_cov_239_532635_g855_i0NODE_1266_length_4939_cov_239_532635_g855_i0_p1_ORF_typecomplete_len536_score57_49Peptidase_C1/PF00112_23/8_1e24CathepsinC_exc/PF08773_11/2_4e08CathepsinC_exc/PF08773_11/7_5e03Peptidase_C1_2/PF03051_15/0_00073BCCT/PF02028_17/0_18_NODE_1266_length_4939_cov_239_532635_g855_i018363443
MHPAFYSILLSLAVADLPVHCTERSVIGDWTFHTGLVRLSQSDVCALANHTLVTPSNKIVYDPICNRVLSYNWLDAYEKNQFGVPQSWSEITSITLTFSESGAVFYGDIEIGTWSLAHDYGFHTRLRDPAGGKRVAHLLSFDASEKVGTSNDGFDFESHCDHTLTSYWSVEDLSILSSVSATIREAINALPAGVQYVCEYAHKQRGSSQKQKIQRHVSRDGEVDSLPSNASMTVRKDGDMNVKLDWSDVRYIPEKIRGQAGSDQLIGPVLEFEAVCGNCYSIAVAQSLTSRLRLRKLRSAAGEHFEDSDLLHSIAIGDLEVDPLPFAICDADAQSCMGGLSIAAFNYARRHPVPLRKCLEPILGKDSWNQFLHVDAAHFCQMIPSPTYSRRALCSADFEPLTCDAYLQVTDFSYIGGQYGDVAAIDMIEELTEGGPFPVAVAVSENGFPSYRGGFIDLGSPTVYRDKGDRIGYTVSTHSMVLIGYGYLDGELYWKVKNTWYDSWGVNGTAWIKDHTGAINTAPLRADLRLIKNFK